MNLLMLAGGYLFYQFKSNRGHQRFEAQMGVHNGRFYPLFGSRYQSIDEFIEKTSNIGLTD